MVYKNDITTLGNYVENLIYPNQVKMMGKYVTKPDSTELQKKQYGLHYIRNKKLVHPIYGSII